MKKYVELLKKYDLSFSREVFYVLLNCINPKIDNYEDLVLVYKDEPNYLEIRKIYKEFYDELKAYLHSMQIDKEMMFHHQVIILVDLILEEDFEILQNYLKMFISNVIDLIFMRYKLNITQFSTNEEIKEYFLTKIKDERIVNLLVLLLLADTTLNNRDLEDIPEEEFEHIVSSIILISIYICKGEK